MITDIFIPQKIGSYQLFPKRIVGFDIGKTHIHATVSYVRGTTTTIERVFHEKIDNGTPAEHGARVSKILANILEKVGSYHEIRTALPNSMIVFKELKLPFTSVQKINMVINFEIEPLLPFSLQDAVIDFIITKTIDAEKSSEILVAAAQKQHIAQHLLLFENAGVHADTITVDFFALYNAFKLIPEYAALPNGVALIDLGHSTTRIAYICDQQLRFIRTISKGVLTIAQQLSTQLNIELNESLENIIRFGLQTHNAQQPEHLAQALQSAWQEIAFTLQSFAAQSHNETISHIFLLGGGAHIKTLPEFVTKQLKVPCTLFDPMLLKNNPNIIIAPGIELFASQSISIATALPDTAEPQFNLKKVEFGAQAHEDSPKYLITTVALVLFITGSLGLHSFLQVRKLSNALYESKKNTLNILRENSKKVRDEVSSEDTEKLELEDSIELAAADVKEAEQLWFSFAKSRWSFLYYLYELTRIIDQQAWGFVPQKIEFKREGADTIIIDGEVKDHDALKKLQAAFNESKIFIPSKGAFENLKFTGMRITVKQPHKGAA